MNEISEKSLSAIIRSRTNVTVLLLDLSDEARALLAVTDDEVSEAVTGFTTRKRSAASPEERDEVVMEALVYYLLHVSDETGAALDAAEHFIQARKERSQP